MDFDARSIRVPELLAATRSAGSAVVAPSTGAHACFVGRDHELQALDAAFGAGEPLITLVGAAGIGKTRLAQQYARVHGGDREVYFCDLTDARSQADVARAMTIGLSLRLDPSTTGRDTQDLVGHALARAADCLVVLDGAEACAAAASSAVAAWMRGARRARFLATSREPLDIASERRLRVGPLPIEDAVMLSRLRVAAARDGDGVGADEHAIVEAICRRVDCVPLAIELALARCAVMSMAVLLGRLQATFEVLSGPRRGRVAHHESMHAAVARSWDLLDDVERAVLAQCAVFRGGFGILAAETVVDLAREPAARPTRDVLQSLIDKSLLHRRARGSDGEPRHDMFAMIREHAHERLVASGEQDRAERRHLAHFVGRVEAGSDLSLDVENLRAAHGRVRDPEPIIAARLVAALVPLLVARARRQLDEGAAEPAEALLCQAFELARQHPDPSLHLHVRGQLGIAAQIAGEPQRAKAHYLAVQDGCQGREMASPESTVVLAHLASVHAVEGEVARARTLLAECRQRSAETDDGQATLIDVLEGFCELANSDAALSRADRWEAHAQLRLARARLDGPGPTSLALRAAQRTLASAISEREQRAGLLRARDDGSWFELFDAPAVELSAKPVLRVLFARLAQARQSSPGRPISHAALIRSLWPEQRGDNHVVMNRLRVAVAALRKLGLQRLIVARHGGYLIDPVIPLEAVAAPTSVSTISPSSRPDPEARPRRTADRAAAPRRYRRG